MVGGNSNNVEQRSIPVRKGDAVHKKKTKRKVKRKAKAILPLAPPPPRPPKPQKQRDTNKPPTDAANIKSPFSSTAESLELIQAYHTLNKRLEQNARDESLTESKRRNNHKSIVEEQRALGGMEKYQLASMYGAKASKFVCARWVEPLLRTHSVDSVDVDSVEDVSKRTPTPTPTPKTKRRVCILDVGAIDNQYLSYDWFDAVAIDLNAQHDSVIQADFFDHAHAHIVAKKDAFDAVVLSLVLNFQGDPRRRGDMIALAADDRLLRVGSGLLFVALPSASLDNSRYCDEEHLIRLCKTLCLEVVERKRSAKLTLLCFRRTTTGGGGGTTKSFQPYNASTKTFNYGKKEMGRPVAKSGKQRNNFAVMLKTSNVPRK
jgi:25S rRNA (adenine2142-N1)-methyltransferase